MRLAVLSDIHGNLRALEAVLRDLEAAGGADKTWVLGDLCLFGPQPAECLQAVRALPHSDVISGNTDRYLVTGERPTLRPQSEADWPTLADKLLARDGGIAWTVAKLSYADYQYLAGLKRELELEIPGYGWVIGYHGTPGNDEGVMLPDTPDDEVLDQFHDREGRLGFGGHTHLPMDRDLGRWRVVNVGSVGIPRDEPRACYALVTFEGGAARVDLRRVPYDMEATIAEVQAGGNPAWAWVADMLRSAR